jgi:hypothetical protein
MKTYIISDIHFSKTKNIKCITDPMDEFIEILSADKDIKRLVVSGDYFDHIFNTGDEEYMIAINYLQKLTGLCDEMICLYGTQSHDRSNYDPILPFLPNHVQFVNTACEYKSKISNETMLLIPEEYPKDFVEYYKEFIDVDENKYSMVIGHGNIIGAKMNDYITIDNGRLGGKAFNRHDLGRIANEVFFGHIHLRQNLLDNVQYVGSMNKTGFGEEKETKGYWIFDTEANYKEFFELKSVHEFKDIGVEEYKTMNEEQLKNAVFRVLYTVDTSESDLQLIKDAGVKSKRSDKTARELSDESNQSKLKYESMDANMDLKSQLLIAYEADKKNNKKIKEKIIEEINNNF